MLFWTKDEYATFRDAIKDRATSLIRIDKTLSRIHKVDYITDPKTSKSKGTIPIPSTLKDELYDYVTKQFELSNEAHLFTPISFKTSCACR